eukprot:3434605-Amphidinium_carterae.1
MAHASGATAAQISAAATGKTQYRCPSCTYSSEHIGHLLKLSINKNLRIRHVTEQAALQQQHQQTTRQTIQSEADRIILGYAGNCPPHGLFKVRALQRSQNSTAEPTGTPQLLTRCPRSETRATCAHASAYVTRSDFA